MELGYFPNKTGFRGRTISIPLEKLSQETPNITKKGTARRVTIGGRGKEWGPECFKVIEDLAKKEEAQIFMHPVDPVKYPQYYVRVKNPIDLSRIQLNFHGGFYTSVFTFNDDIQLMFKNHLLLYDDSLSSIHQNIVKMKVWFDNEMEKIKKKRFCSTATSDSNGSGYARLLVSKEISDHIDAIEAQNRNIVGSPFFVSLSSTVASSNKLVKSQPITREPAYHLTPIQGLSSNNTTTPISKFPSRGPGASPSSPRPLYTIHVPKGSKNSQIFYAGSGKNPPLPSVKTKPIVFIPSCVNPLTASSKNSVVFISNHSIGNVGVSSFPLSGNSEVSSFPSIGNSEVSSFPSIEEILENGESHRIHDSISNELEDGNTLSLHATNIWLGGSQVFPTKPVVISDEGILIACQIDSFLNRACKKAKKQTGLFQFLIGPDDLIQGYNYRGNSGKHTIFLVVLPNFIRRLGVLVRDSLRKDVMSEEEEKRMKSLQDSHLITIFTSLTRIQVSQLMSFMWSIGKSSIFARNLYCEVDKKASLNLLSNIKPALLNSRHFNDNQSTSTNFNKSSRFCDLISSKRKFNISNSNLSAPLGKSDLESDLKSDLESDLDLKKKKLCKDGDESMSTVSCGDDVKIDVTSMNKDLSDFHFQVINLPDSTSDEPKTRHKPGILSRSGRRKNNSLSVNIVKNVKNDLHVTKDYISSVSNVTCKDLIITPKLLIKAENLSQASETGRKSGNETSDKVENFIDSHSRESHSRDSHSRESHFCPSDIPSATNEPPRMSEDVVVMEKQVDFKCPVTQKMMNEPMRNTKCGHSYDKDGAHQLIKQRGEKAKCPVFGCHNLQLKLSHLVPDEKFKKFLA